jgi:hypothetical protein
MWLSWSSSDKALAFHQLYGNPTLLWLRATSVIKAGFWLAHVKITIKITAKIIL